MKKIEVTIGLLLLILTQSSYAKLPKSISICSRNEVKLSDCIINSVKELQPKLASGRLDDEFIVPALEPLMLDNIKMERGQEFKASFTNINVKGPSNFIIEKLRANLDNTTFDFIITIPKLEFVGKYTLKIKILLLDISGKGDMDGSFENSRARVKMQAKKYQKNGETYIKFDLFNIKIQVGKNKINLKNLFNGDPNLGRIGNQFINENSELFLAEIIPGLEKNLAEIFTKTANEIVENASFDEMFPNN
ncbi:hypothetical protein PVAND_005552 [Polypedilum vanderplanki]|uniref:Hemolymph juvenile hormone binding protein n=1 Tax=Polypedilum vanderplanki TaxID=319348 RepID=A0A9J6C0C1_POLVA|nr:hypothetical protein PVAND_005552 [Polypedilum vanderplanki]